MHNRKITNLVLTFFIITSLTFSLQGEVGNASTVYNYNKAAELQEWGILRGSDLGFELERPLSRVEGSVMLVRLLGDEQFAFSQKYNHPFLDVPLWADDYIGYLYEKGLTKGVSVNRFASQDLMTSTQYATFILRALGYDDSQGDFQWNIAVDKLLEIGAITTIEANRSLTGGFLRDDMVGFSYQALHAYRKGSTTTLLEQLVEKGAIPTIAIEEEPEDVVNILDVITIQGFAIGDSNHDVITKRGNPDRIDASQYDFKWNIYNANYDKYLQVGVKDNTIVALYSSILPWEGLGLDNKVNRTQVRQELGNPIEYVLINNTRYREQSNERDIYLLNEQYYLYVYYDLHENDRVKSILLLDKGSRESLPAFVTSGSEELARAFELQVFDLTNVMRTQRNLPTFTWSEEASKTARDHSYDMATLDYFAHDNLLGQSPFNRMRNDGIQFQRASENIAAGQEDAIVVHTGWMNSAGHRMNLLSNQKYLGVGVSFGGSYGIYYTQKFFTP